MRGTGQTFRLLLSGIQHALEGDGRLVMIIFGEPREIIRCTTIIYDVLRPIHGFVEHSKDDRSFKFGNGSKIALRDTEYVEKFRWAGRHWTKVVEDNSVNFVPKRDQYHGALHELQLYVRARSGK